jgi:mono/diheme cytochrome c family protein
MRHLLLLAASLSLSLAACGDAATKKADPKVAAEAKQVWDTRCVTCHGKTGKGDGPGSAALDPKPRSFGDKKWQAETNDDRIKKVIVEGGAAVGLNATMAPNPDLAEKPAVVAELVNTIRGFK